MVVTAGFPGAGMTLFLAFPIQLVLYGGLAGGQLVGLLVFGQLLGLTYVATHRRVPVAVACVVVGLFFVLQPVKAQYRLETWYGARPRASRGAGRVLEMGGWHFWTARPLRWRDSLLVAYSRIDHLHVTAAIIASTPDPHPFRYGETYVPLITKWIPRVLWADKPREDLGNRWAQDYGFLFATDDVTSFNLPWLSEMYMNFGWPGVVFVSLLRWHSRQGGLVGPFQPRHSPLGFAVALTVLSEFFFPESNLSMGSWRRVRLGCVSRDRALGAAVVGRSGAKRSWRQR